MYTKPQKKIPRESFPNTYVVICSVTNTPEWPNIFDMQNFRSLGTKLLAVQIHLYLGIFKPVL